MFCSASLRAIFTTLSLISLYISSAHTERSEAKKDGTDFFQFRTRPDIAAPRWRIVKQGDANKLAPGYWFVAPYKNLKVAERGKPWIGPHIYDQNGQLIWSGSPTFDHFKSFDLRIAQINGVDMLTTIYPKENSAVVIDNSYRVVKTIVHSSAWEYSNMHDFNVVEDGTRALVLTKDAEKELSREQSEVVGYHGNCVVRGDGIKYLDITTSPAKELFVWNGTDHIGLDETLIGRGTVDERCSPDKMWDIHHTNAIDLMPDGDFLLSARSCSTVYKISHTDGSIVWRLGGIKSDFEFGPDAEFNFQHHARVHSQNETHTLISLFDNSKHTDEESEIATRPTSAGLILSLDTVNMKVDLVAQYKHPEGEHTWKRGSAHVLPNGNVFMGWADDTRISEHAPDGTLLMEAKFKPALDSYRSYKFEWVGRPASPPNVYSAAFVSGNHTSTMIYVSWNGDTEAVKWNFYKADADGKKKHLLGAEPRHGFETSIEHDGYVRYVFAEAFDMRGKSLGQSRVVHTSAAVEDEAESVSGDGTLNDVEDSTLDTSPNWLSKTTTETTTVTEYLSHEASAGVDMPKSDAGSQSWSVDTLTSIVPQLIVAFVTGCFICGILCGMLWALRTYRTKQDKDSKGEEYEPLNRNRDEEPDDEEIAEKD